MKAIVKVLIVCVIFGVIGYGIISFSLTEKSVQESYTIPTGLPNCDQGLVYFQVYQFRPGKAAVIHPARILDSSRVKYAPRTKDLPTDPVEYRYIGTTETGLLLVQDPENEIQHYVLENMSCRSEPQ